MVLKDAEIDELWRALGHYRGKIKEHLEVATDTEATMSSQIAERLFREYRDLKADYEHDHESLEKLQADYQKRIAELKKGDPTGELRIFERQLSQFVSDIATFNLDRQTIVTRVADIRNKIRSRMQALGYKGPF